MTVTFSDKTYQRLLELKQASDAGQNWLRLNNFGDPKEVSRQRVVCSGLTIGSSRFTNVPGYIRERNVLGAGLLMNMRVSIDGKGGLLYVQRNTNTHIDWFPRNDSGIMFTFPDSSRLLIDSLIEKSPGTQAGLEANDEILSIEGKSPRELTVDSVRGYLSQSDTPVRIVYSRNGKQHETMLSIPKTYEYPPKWEKSPEEKAREFFERME